MSMDDNLHKKNGMHRAKLFNSTYHLISHLVSRAIAFRLLQFLYRVGLVAKAKYLFMHQEYG